MPNSRDACPIRCKCLPQKPTNLQKKSLLRVRFAGYFQKNRSAKTIFLPVEVLKAPIGNVGCSDSFGLMGIGLSLAIALARVAQKTRQGALTRGCAAYMRIEFGSIQGEVS